MKEKLVVKFKRAFIDQVNGDRWYVVDASKRKQWDKWQEKVESGSWLEVPEYAILLPGHPCNVSFQTIELTIE